MFSKRLKRTALVLALMLAQCGMMHAYKQEKVAVRANGSMRSMEVFTPNNLKPNMPLMLVTHGMNQDPEYQMGADKMYQIIDKEGFVLAYLRSKADKTWDIGGSSDQEFVIEAIRRLYTDYDIDPHRVYWTGFSMGSMLMYHCIPNMQGKIAAFAPTSGINFSEQPWTRCKRPLNLMHLHAYGDDVFNYESYGIHNYVEKMANVNNPTDYKKVTGYKAPTAPAYLTGDKETWSDDKGHQVVLFSYNGGGHWPQQPHSQEIWNFCKQFSLSDDEMDPIEKLPVRGGTYSVDESSEITDAVTALNSKLLIMTDVDKNAILYVNSGLESPQNVRNGSFSDYYDNPLCFFKFKHCRLSSISGNFYTLQMASEYGDTYSLWNTEGYLNCTKDGKLLFALGLTGDKNYKYGQDADFTGLWHIEYEEGKGYTIQNVYQKEKNKAGGYITPAAGGTSDDKVYVRLFSKVAYKEPSGIEDITVNTDGNGRTYDLMGRQVTALRPGSIYIKNGRKYIYGRRQ